VDDPHQDDSALGSTTGAAGARRPTLLIVSFSPLRSDPRILRQISTFRHAYDITTVGYGPAPDGVAGHHEVPVELDPMRPSFRHYMALLAARLFRRTYFGSRRVRHVLDRVEAGSMDIVLANDADAAPVAIRLEPRLGVHVDLHEFAPRQRENETWWRLLVAPFSRWMVRRYVAAADSATTVSPGLAREYERRFGISAEVVPNAAPLRADLGVRPTPRTGPVRLVHTGAASRARRLEIMVEAVDAVNRERPGSFVFDLYLKAGDAPYIDELRRTAEGSTDGAVRVLDPVPFDRMIETMTGYDVGMFVCPPTTFNLEHALPNKLFEFVQARLAVVIGPSPDMREYVDRHGLGVVADDFTAPALSRALSGLTVDDVDRYKESSDRAARPMSAEVLSQAWTDAIGALSSREKESRR
jgi:hypothetical protein